MINVDELLEQYAAARVAVASADERGHWITKLLAGQRLADLEAQIADAVEKNEDFR